jgi:hypothetical protein
MFVLQEAPPVGFEKILKVIVDNGTAVAVIALVLFLGAWWFVVNVIYRTQPNVTTQTKPYGIRHHYFWQKMHYFISSVIPNLEIEDELREVIFKDLLTIVLTAYWKKLYNFVDAGDLDQMSQQDFAMKAESLIDQITLEWENNARRKKNPIPEVVLSLYKKWDEKHNSRLKKALTDIPRSPFYPSNTVRMVAILDQMAGVFYDILTSTYETLNDLNGDLDEVSYGGVIGTPHHKSTKSGSSPVRVSRKTKGRSAKSKGAASD